jgi:thiamine biosynthesis protein ThiS
MVLDRKFHDVSEARMDVTVNGDAKSVEPDITASALLETLDVSAEAAVVSLNGAVLSLDKLESTRLSEGDAVELFAFVGGG